MQKQLFIDHWDFVLVSVDRNDLWKVRDLQIRCQEEGTQGSACGFCLPPVPMLFWPAGLWNELKERLRKRRIMDKTLTAVQVTSSWFTKLVGNRLKVYFKNVLGVWKIKRSKKLQTCRRHLPKNLAWEWNIFNDKNRFFLSKKEEEESHVHHVCKTFLRNTAVATKLSAVFWTHM